MKSYLGIAVVAGLAVVLSAGAGPAAGAAVAPQGTELFRCQVHRGGGRDTRPDNALETWPKNNSPKSVAKADRFLEESLDRMKASGWKGVSQVQIHIRTDLSLPDPFCPSSDCIRRAIKRLHANGITVQAFTWTEGANKDVLRKIWKLGFDNFATDDPLTLFELLPELQAGVKL